MAKFQEVKAQLIKRLEDEEMNVDLINEKAKSLQQGTKDLLEDIIHGEANKNNVDKWRLTANDLLNNNLAYISGETQGMEIAIASATNVPIGVKQDLKILRNAINVAEESKKEFGEVRNAVVDRIKEVPDVESVDFDKYEAISSLILTYKDLDSKSKLYSHHDLFGADTEEKVLEKAQSVKESFEERSRDDILEFNRRVRSVKEIKDDFEKSDYGIKDIDHMNSLLIKIDEIKEECTHLKIPADSLREMGELSNPLMKAVYGRKEEMKDLYSNKRVHKKAIKAALKELTTKFNALNKKLGNKSSVFDLDNVTEVTELRKGLTKDRFETLKQLPNLVEEVHEYEKRVSNINEVVGKITEKFDTEFEGMLEIYSERLDDQLTISRDKDIDAQSSRINNEIMYLQAVVQGCLPVSEDLTLQLQDMVSKYQARGEDIDKVINRRTKIKSLKANIETELDRTKEMSLEEIEYGKLQRLSETIAELSKRRGSFGEQVETFVAANDEYVGEEIGSLQQSYKKLKGEVKEINLNYRELLNSKIINCDEGVNAEEVEIRLSLLEKALTPIRNQVDCEEQIERIESKRKSWDYLEKEDGEEKEETRSYPCCLEAEVDKLKAPDFPMSKLQGILAGDNNRDYVKRIKEYNEHVDDLDGSKLTNQRRDYLNNIADILETFGYSVTCANLDDGPYVMQLVFKAEKLTRKKAREKENGRV
jgi:hypothetical protein